MVLLITEGFQVPTIPFVEVVGNVGAVLPEQSVFAIENVGVIELLTVTFNVNEVAHCPAFGVKT